MADGNSDTVIQLTLGGEAVRRPTCEPLYHPHQECGNDVERVLTVYYGDPAMATIEWAVCEDHAEDVRESGEVKEDRPYCESEDGFVAADGGDRLEPLGNDRSATEQTELGQSFAATDGGAPR